MLNSCAAAAYSRAALKRRLAAATERADVEQRLISQLEQAVFEYEDARRTITLYRDSLVPRSREALEATIGAYRGGTVGFLDVIDAERVMLELELSLRRAETDAANALATIDRLVGANVEES